MKLAALFELNQFPFHFKVTWTQWTDVMMNCWKVFSAGRRAVFSRQPFWMWWISGNFSLKALHTSPQQQKIASKFWAGLH